jgi:hypothetical protein
MQIEVEVHRNELGDYVVEAVEYGVQAIGRTENEALAKILEVLAQHFKTSPPTR